jgi:hypothetical protein
VLDWQGCSGLSRLAALLWRWERHQAVQCWEIERALEKGAEVSIDWQARGMLGWWVKWGKFTPNLP